MSSKQFILAIDQGTSSTKSLIFDAEGQAVARGTEPLATQYGDNGFVEQDPEGIFQNVLASVQKCLDDFRSKGFSTASVATIGISNQRETFLLWDKEGKPLCNAIVWQCKRSVDICEEWKQQGYAETVIAKTGLWIDPYFSASKLVWLLRNNEALRNAVEKGEAYFGTIDTWLLYRFTGGKEYATDHTNASRTMLFNLQQLSWDMELLELFGLKGLQLPEIKASAACYGESDLEGLLDKPVPVNAMVGDSHAAAFGEGCFEAGSAKATMGTGCSILMNTGNKPVASKNGMLTTVCWSRGDRIDYALEGVIVSCGATLEWLKKEFRLFEDPAETAAIALSVSSNGGVYLVPAFSGLGSPHWDMERKASVSGLSFGSTKQHVLRAALESIPYQVKDIIGAMEKDAGISLQELNADGGISANTFVMQFLANLLQKKVASIGMPDVSALGAACLAGLEAGIFSSLEQIAQRNISKKYFEPAREHAAVDKDYKGWLLAIKKNK